MLSKLISTLYFLFSTQQSQSVSVSFTFSLSFSLTLPYFSPYGSTSNLSVFYFFAALAWVVSYINILHVLSRRHKMLNLVQICKRFSYRTPCSLQVSKVSLCNISFRKNRTNERMRRRRQFTKRLIQKM